MGRKASPSAQKMRGLPGNSSCFRDRHKMATLHEGTRGWK